MKKAAQSNADLASVTRRIADRVPLGKGASSLVQQRRGKKRLSAAGGPLLALDSVS
jgi:hypothetical protein